MVMVRNCRGWNHKKISDKYTANSICILVQFYNHVNVSCLTFSIIDLFRFELTLEFLKEIQNHTILHIHVWVNHISINIFQFLQA
jgi:hypothetical protein